MKPRYSFSSRHNRRTENIGKQKKKYPLIADKIIEDSDIILEIVDSRFVEETRNEDFEEKVFENGKYLVYVFNKSDLVKKVSLKKFDYLNPKVFVSSTERKGIKDLRNLIKKLSKKVSKPVNKDGSGKISVGVIGYPNVGKSTLINVLIGKSSAGTSSQSGFTKALQKLKLSEDIFLLDSPGVIPEKEYSSSDRQKIAQHAKLGARDFSKVKDPEMAVFELIKTYMKEIEDFYVVDSEGDSEILIEKLGRKKGFFKKGGVVDEDKTARAILKDWQLGRIKL
jgi:hypothetical protein